MPDSASTATAFLCGVKGNYYTVGLSAKARFEKCAESKGAEVDSVLIDAYKAGNGAVCCLRTLKNFHDFLQQLGIKTYKMYR